jgi:hypothetical protein
MTFQVTAYSDDYWECVVRHFTYPLYHEAGSCPMGPASDPKVINYLLYHEAGIYRHRRTVSDRYVICNSLYHEAGTFPRDQPLTYR